MKKVCIVNSSLAYHMLFTSYGFEVVDYVPDDTLRPVDLLVFTGGADVSPGLYGHPEHATTYNDVYRDQREAQIFENALLHNIPMVGICRGGQFLNVMSGGEMYQDVGGHGMPHEITDLVTGETVYVSSTHHQMMKPSSEGLLVASSHIGGYREHWDGGIFKRETSEQDVEVVFYEDTRSLCFQPHPEFTSPEYIGMHVYFRSLLERYLGV